MTKPKKRFYLESNQICRVTITHIFTELIVSMFTYNTLLPQIHVVCHDIFIRLHKNYITGRGVVSEEAICEALML